MRRNLKGLQPHDGNGKLIAYGKGGSIAIVDAETRRERPLLVGEATMRYTSIY